MESYKRLVSYIYNYENGVKGNNVGYARIEIRNSQCKITVHIRVLSLSEKQLNSYIFHRENELVNCISLGSVAVKNGVYECRFVTRTDDMLESGYSFEEMSGLIIYASKDKYFGTEWDDKPIDLENIDVTINKIKEQPQLEEEVESDIEAAQIAVTRVEEAVEIPDDNELDNVVLVKEMADINKFETDKEEMNAELMKAEQVKAEQVKAEQVKAEQVKAEQMKAEQMRAEQMKAEQMNIENKGVPGGDKNRIDQIFLKYPKMYPFEDDEIVDCVRIEPQDIGIFPMEYWVYANNSFLLHSYYSYRHLVFAKKKQGNRVEYILGVPGIYHNREQFMARMFGFPSFKPIKSRELKAGEFGYWFFNMML